LRRQTNGNGKNVGASEFRESRCSRGRWIAVKIRELIAAIEADGWAQVRQRGSHREFRHAWKLGLVTIAGKPGDDLARRTLNSVLKQAGLKP